VQLHQHSNLNLSSRQPGVRVVWCSCFGPNFVLQLGESLRSVEFRPTVFERDELSAPQFGEELEMGIEAEDEPGKWLVILNE
jgi:hypothetical protein